jgi:hypothetical protein
MGFLILLWTFHKKSSFRYKKGEGGKRISNAGGKG